MNGVTVSSARVGWARGDSASGSCPARSEGIRRAQVSKHNTSARHAPNRTLPLVGSASVAVASVIAHTASRRPRRTRGILGAGEVRPVPKRPAGTGKNKRTRKVLRSRSVATGHPPRTKMFLFLLDFTWNYGPSCRRIGGIRLKLRFSRAARRQLWSQGCSKAPVLSSCSAASAEWDGALTLS